MNFYKHYISDFNGHTAHLDWLEDCAYSRLLRIYYLRENPIPLELSEVYRLVRAVDKQQRDAVKRVLKEFFSKRMDGFHQKRCDAELKQYLARAETNRRIAQLRAVPTKKG